MHQFLKRAIWKEHIYRHVETLDESKPLNCPYPGLQCRATFNSVGKLKFHLQDIYCLDFIKEPKSLKRSKEDCEVEMQPAEVKRQRSGYKKESSIGDKALAKVGYGFINKTIESISQCPSNRSITPSSRSILDFGIRISSSWTKNGSFPSTDTPPLSVCSRILEKIDPRLLPQVATRSSIMSKYNTIDMVDLTNLDKDRTLTPNRKNSDATLTSRIYQ